MKWLNRSTLYAGVLSCVLHILLLGLAASVLITLPGQSSTPVRVTVLQRAVPLPIQELPKGEEGLKETPTPPMAPSNSLQPQRVVPRPVTKKKPVPITRPRPPKPPAQPQHVPPPDPPLVAKEEPSQVAPETPPAPENPVQESGAAFAGEQTLTVSEGAGNTDTSVSGSTGGATHLAERTGGGGNGGAGAGGLSASPDYNVNPKPPYPLIARRIGAQGEVLLRVLVRPDGSVATVELARSSGFPLLDESATRTVRDNWRFIPAQLDGTPVESWVEVPIKFVLADS